ncbi:High affinity Ca2+/Mn2+ P-type ATPase-like protein [Marasmius crinis-equi]|uniref:High affinity Ca2+/Mn2+ P-type ATPase-like protein n=1 Tax=Marasmius crinis-equi TaxID=585013 RepID=A0ABR3F2X5_9AGAR
MNHPRATSLGVGQQSSYDSRKRVPAYFQPANSPSSPSFSRHINQASLPAHLHSPVTGRSASPPASAYFQNGQENLTPTADAGSHFAYSTTLRRHHVEDSAEVLLAHEAQGLWDKVLGWFNGTGEQKSQDVEERIPLQHRKREQDTPSAKFAHTSIEDTIAYYRTDPTQGLHQSSITPLLQTHGYNEFSVATPEPVLIKFIKTIYENPLILLLCGSATVSAVMGNIDDAVSITVAVLIVLTVGFVQERRSEKSLEALNKLVPHHCHVIRSGQTHHILANELVPGDLVSFSTGDRIPADIRIISAADLEIDESSLTGETEARRKGVDAQPWANGGLPNGMGSGEPAALADRACIAYMGTLVRNGRASGIVIATGSSTEFGAIFELMSSVEEKRTPLQLSMDELAKKLSILSFGVIGIICLIGVWQQRSWLDMFTIGVSLAVAAIPEGLPIVTTVTLALGVLRMSKRKAIVKKLHSVESLGSVSVICSDKTGTLTKNEQTVTEGYTVDEFVKLDPSSDRFLSQTSDQDLQISSALRKTIEIGAICNNAVIIRNDDGRTVVGQGTDVALINVVDAVKMGSVQGQTDLRDGFNRTGEKPFSSEHKWMAVSGTYPGAPQTELYYTKGSIEAVLERCKFYYVNDGSTPGLDANIKSAILGRAKGVAARGLRVIGMAYGYGNANANIPSNYNTPTHSNGPSRAHTPVPDKDNLVFTGFLAMYDPPRKGVPDSIGLLQSGGVQVVMITGDAEPTALSIARQLGLRVGTGHGHEHDRAYCLTGKEIDSMSRAQLRERVGSVTVFARTTPRHKMAIVEAFQSRGEVVAMTGDGVNDAPALKVADIGVSMGKSGTDVAKEAADVILVDDNFSTILFAVEEGKSIFYNIQNFLSFQLSTAAAALTLITLSTMLGLSNPLNAMQILFINILMDGPPSQSLGVDPVDPSIMRKPPRRKDAPIITQRVLYRVLFSASMIVLGTLFIYVFALSDDRMSKREQTMTFTCFVFLDLVSAIQNRGINCGLTENRMLVTTVSISAITQLCLIYVPLMQSVFQTAALSFNDLSVLLLLAGASFTLHEMRRRWERTGGGVSGSSTVIFGDEADESWRGRVQERV